MHVVGHIAVGQLLAWPPGQKFDGGRTFAVILGALTPDLIDKSLKLFGVYPWGRTVGHSVFFWILIALIAALASERGRGARLTAFALGGFSHMIADFADDLVGGLHYTGYLVSAWFTWPYFNPDLYPITAAPVLVDHACLGLYTAIEAFVLALVILRATAPNAKPEGRAETARRSRSL